MRARRATAIVALALACASCGGTSRRTTAQRDVALGPEMEIPGTGVRLRPPSGAELLPLGPGVHVPRVDTVLVVALADGPPDVHEALREGLGIRARPRATGRTVERGEDRVDTAQGSLPRLTLYMQEGQRSLAVIATMRDEPERKREVEAALRTVEWDETATLDPELAIGLRVQHVEGLVPDRSTVGTVAFVGERRTFPPPPGEPMFFVLPMPREPPADLAACERALVESGAIGTPDREVTEIDVDGHHGCEGRGARAKADGSPFFAYGAIVALDVGLFVVMGAAPIDQADMWAARFADATRTLRHTR